MNWRRIWDCVVWFAIAVLVCSAISDVVYGAEPGIYAPSQQMPYRAVAQLNLAGVQGSGTLIAKARGTGLMVSCRHVNRRVGDRVLLTWKNAGGQQTIGVVYEVIPGNTFNSDLAIIICQVPAGVEPVAIAPFDPRNGRWVSVGFRDGVMRIAVANRAHIEGNLVNLNSPFVGGMSGGATFDRYGRLVAVVVASDLRTLGVSVDGPLLHAVVDKYRRGK